LVFLPPPFADVSICGLDDPWTGSRDAATAFAGAQGVRVLLMHSPAGLLLTKDERFDVALCGHTHGGHIALPGGIPIIATGPTERRHSHGRHELPQGTLIVSRGVGATESPLRMFADPDVLCVELIPPTNGDAARRRAGCARDA
jgi:predicted MPP superfamily phosphohydrolase